MAYRVKATDLADGAEKFLPTGETAALKVEVSGPNVLLGRLTTGAGGHEEINPAALTEETAPAAGDFLPIWTGDGLRKVDFAEFGGGGSSTPVTISPSELTASVNDWNPTGLSGATIVRVSSDASMREITGLATGADGRTVTIMAVGSNPFVLVAKSGLSSSSNRFNLLESIVLYPGNCVSVNYDNTDSVWQIGTPVINSPAHRFNNYVWTPGSATAGDQSTFGFSVVGAGAAVSSNSATASTPSMHWQNTTGTTAAGASAVHFPKSGASMYFTAGFASLVGVIQIGTLSDASNRYTTWFYLRNAPSALSAPTANTVGIRYSDTLNSGKWQAFSINSGGTETTLDTGVAATTTPMSVVIEVNFLGTEVRFYLGGSYIGQITTNLPTSTTMGGAFTTIKTVGTTSRSFATLAMRCRHYF